MKLRLFSVVLVLGFAGCDSQSFKNEIPSKNSERIKQQADALAENEIQVLDMTYQPVRRAVITVGAIELVTDTDGIAQIPREWQNPTNLTIKKNGIVTTVYANQYPQKNV